MDIVDASRAILGDTWGLNTWLVLVGIRLLVLRRDFLTHNPHDAFAKSRAHVH